jgi:hypothetical protein
MRVRWLNNCCSFKFLSLDPDNSKMIVYEHVPLNDIKFYGEIVQWLAACRYCYSLKGQQLGLGCSNL